MEIRNGMKIKIALSVFFLLILTVSPSFAQDMLGLGVHLGVHHDVGNPSGQDPDLIYEPQNSLLLGFSFKINMHFLFLRTGFDTAFLVNKAKVHETSGSIESSSYKYIVVPAFIGIRYPLRNIGEFYMGAGVAYFLGTGNVTPLAGSREDVDATASGYGFITGIEFKFFPSIHLYMEWEYFDSRSEAELNTAGESWDNYHVDFSGHRILLGAMYYII